MLVENWTEQSDRESGYLWLWRLRWFAALALVLGAGAVAGFLQVRLPVTALIAVVAVLLVTNGWAHPRRRIVRQHCGRFIAGWLMLDVILLTIVLYFTGGAHNPLTMLYLLYVAMAVILLPTAGAWLVVALSVGAFAVLFESHHMLIAQDGRHLCSDMDFHLKGMVLGLGLAGAGVVYFISSLNRALRVKHNELERIRGQMQAQRTLVETSVLAATVAHELATPLGTIAVIGSDLKSMADDSIHGAQFKEDARLIEESIQRCRRALALVGQMDSSPAGATSETVSAEVLFERLSVYLTKDELSRVETANPSGIDGLIRVPLRELVVVVSILIRNALEASKDDTNIKVFWRPHDTHVNIDVEDSGVGMDATVLAQAVEPFFTTKRAGEGIGLGLYLARMFCERHGGQLCLAAEPGRGCCAGLRLPVSEKPGLKT